MFEIIFDEKAIELLEKINTNSREWIFKKIISTKENPHRYFEKLIKKDL